MTALKIIDHTTVVIRGHLRFKNESASWVSRQPDTGHMNSLEVAALLLRRTKQMYCKDADL
jgi:hypothetical protein